MSVKYNPVRAWPHRRVKTFQIHNWTGYLALYLVAFIVVTSYFRETIGRRQWKLLHFTTYAAANVFLVHSILTDPTLKDKPIDYFDGEKVYIEILAMLVLAAVYLRIRHRWVRHVMSVAVRTGSSTSRP